MIRLIALKTLLLLTLTYNLTFGHSKDITVKNTSIEQTVDNAIVEHDSSEYNGTDDFSPGLLFFALIGFAFILVCVGAGIVLTTLGILIIFGLIGAGILSTSIIVGLNKKSFASGFKTFLVSTTTIGGIIFGMTGLWILNKITHWWTLQTTLIAGSISGLLAGLIFGLFAFYVIRKLTTFLRNKLNAV